MSSITTITTKGQIVIPKQIRTQLDLHPGIKLSVEIVDGLLVLQPVDTQSQLDRIHTKVRKHMISHNISPVSDEGIQQARLGVWNHTS